MPEVLRGRYEVLGWAGDGGEARVVRALDRQHGRLVALKIRPLYDETRRADLLGEARLLLEVSPHRNLPLVREDFFDDDRYVIAMDWVEGTNLSDLLRREGRPGLPVASVLRWLADAASALTHLHTQSPPVVHRDVKPANLVLTSGGRVVLVDFGLSSSPTAEPRWGGTPYYVAPELAGGGVPTRASDVYGLAATAWALLTGSAPTGVHPGWTGIDPVLAERLDEAIRAGLATDPARRPSTPGELVERIRAGSDSTLPTGVLTFCCTQIDESGRLWEAEPAAMAQTLVRHDDLLAGIVEAHGGRFLKSGGDGDATLSVFTSAIHAVNAAAEMHRRSAVEAWPNGLALQLRIGAHTGEAERRGDSYLGVAPTIGARLRDLARAGELLLSGETAALVRPALPDGATLVDLGAHRIDGVASPVAVLAVSAPGVLAPPAATTSPYPGLRPFDISDRERYQGRENLTAEVVDRLGRSGRVVLVGSSGSGKSSLLRAGIAPSFPGARVIQPGASLALPAPDLALLVDQFEELFTAVPDAARRASFIDEVLDRPGPVAIGIRADFYARCAEHERLARTAAANHILVGPMTAEEVRRAIVGPAESAGLRVEPGLVDLLVNEIAGEPGALPLLSHALLTTWEQRDGRTLTLAAYHRTGGVRAAIATTAERVFAGLDRTDQGIARSVFLRLVEPGDGVEDSRRRTPRDELRRAGMEHERIDRVLSAFTESRLLNVDEGTIEVAHEALIRAWPRLRAWVDEDREGLRTHRHLTATTESWVRLDRDPGELYRSTRLVSALEWAQDHGNELNPREREFLDASVAAEEGLRRSEERRHRRLRRLLAATAVALVVTAVATILAVVQGRQAADQRDLAIGERRRADAARLSALSAAAVEDQADLGLLLAVAAQRTRPGPETDSAVLAALSAHPQLMGRLNAPNASMIGMGFTPDGRTLVTPVLDEGVVLWDVGSRRPIARLTTGGEVAEAAAVSSDGHLLVVAANRLAPDGRRLGRLQVWNLETRELQRVIDTPPGVEHLSTAAFASDGALFIAQVSLPGAPTGPALGAMVWDTGTWEQVGEPWRLGDVYPYTDAVWVSPRGDLLAVPGEAASVQVFEIATRRPVAAPLDVTRVVGPEAGRVATASFSPDGSVLAVASEANGEIALLEPRTGSALGEPLRLRSDNGKALGFRGDGRVLAVGGSDGKVQLYDLQEHKPLGTPFGSGTTDVFRMAWSPGGDILATANLERSGSLWAMDGRRATGVPLRGQAGPVTDVEYSRNGDALFTVAHDGSLALRDPATGEIRASRSVGGPLEAVALDPASPRVASGGVDGKVTLWSRDGLEPAGPELNVGPGRVFDLAFRPDGRELAVAIDGTGGRPLATGPGSGRVRFLDPATGGDLAPPLEFRGGPAIAVAFSPDGRHLAAVEQGRIHVVDVRSRTAAYEPIRFDGYPTSLAFSPDGDELFVGTVAGAVMRFSIATGREVAPPLAGENGFVMGVAVSSDGRWVAGTTLVLSTTRIWDVDAGRQVGDNLAGGRIPLTPRDLVYAVDFFPARPAFSTDGTRLATAGSDGAAMLWDLRPERWVAAACAVAGRDLTRYERNLYFTDDPDVVVCPNVPAAS